MTKKNNQWESLDDFLAYYTMPRTPKVLNPDRFKPMPVTHVVWDADDTIWDVKPMSLASNCGSPYKNIGEGVIEGVSATLSGESIHEPCYVELKEGFLETLDKLEKRGIRSSIASINDFNTVKDILSALGIEKRFQFLAAGWGHNKSRMVTKISEQSGDAPEDMLFIDDSIMNVTDVQNEANVRSLNMGLDIQAVEEILDYIA